MQSTPDRPINIKCSTCRWFDNYDRDTDDGLCRLRPPAALPPEGVSHGSAYWPITHVDDWCGKHEPDTEEKIESGQYERMPDGALIARLDWRPNRSGE